MILLVTGSRTWTAYEPLRDCIAALNPALIIHGGARGADALAQKAAIELGIPTRIFPADWSLGRGAGHIRNAQMLYEGHPSQVLACWDGSSKGTKGMMDLAQKAGVPIEMLTIARTPLRDSQTANGESTTCGEAAATSTVPRVPPPPALPQQP